METTISRAQLEVAAIEVDGECDHLAALAARLPVEERVELILALAELEKARDRWLAER